MMYTVKRIDEDLNFGCEERPDDAPVMAIVTLVDSSGKEVTVKAEDAMLYERNINEGDKVCLDVNNKLEKSYNQSGLRGDGYAEKCTDRGGRSEERR